MVHLASDGVGEGRSTLGDVDNVFVADKWHFLFEDLNAFFVEDSDAGSMFQLEVVRDELLEFVECDIALQRQLNRLGVVAIAIGQDLIQDAVRWCGRHSNVLMVELTVIVVHFR
jgi:hypothetical protein